MQESYTFLDELTQLLDLGAIYQFPKKLNLDNVLMLYCHLEKRFYMTNNVYLIESINYF